MFAPAQYRAWTVNTVIIPEGIDDIRVRRKLVERHGIEIVGGLESLKGRIWRIGLMGSSSLERNVLLFLGALDEILAEEGYRGPRGTGVTAAADHFKVNGSPPPAPMA